METSSILLDKPKESFYLNKCIIYSGLPRPGIVEEVKNHLITDNGSYGM